VSDHQGVHQIEFRWQPDKDLSPIASSFESTDITQSWFARLAGIIRPFTPDSSLGVPGRSLVYQTFAERSAVIVWRHYETDAITLQDKTARRPLVTRALLGDVGVLRPEVAMALCRANQATVLTPLPGRVQVGAGLPLIPVRVLASLPTTIMSGLDESACEEQGLNCLIAAALRHLDTPLSIVLPGAEMLRAPAHCRQLPLLWGLWRTTASLVAEASAVRPRWASWSFSTYEPPLGDTETSGLADIVFRSDKQERQPQSVRRETTVRPRDRPTSTEQDPYDALAGVLIDAYRALGGLELDRLLDLIARDYRHLNDRLRAADEQLAKFKLRPAGIDGERPPGQITLADWQPSTVRPASHPGSAHEPVFRTEPTPQSAVPTQSEHTHQPFPPARYRRARRDEPLTLTALLDRLHAGPSDPGFAAARDFLCRERPNCPPDARAKARSMMPGRRWYVPELILDDRWHVEDTLEAIFRITVIPDLGKAEVGVQLTRWAQDSPAEVIRGLSAAAHHDGANAVHLLQEALQPALCQRWLAEHSIHTDLVAAAAGALPPQHTRKRRPRWQIFETTPHSGPIASILAWVCLVLILLLVGILL